MGGWTNLFSNMVITGLVMYITAPEIFTTDRWNRMKNYAWNIVRPPLEKKMMLEYENGSVILPKIPVHKITILSPDSEKTSYRKMSD